MDVGKYHMNGWISEVDDSSEHKCEMVLPCPPLAFSAA